MARKQKLKRITKIKLSVFILLCISLSICVTSFVIVIFSTISLKSISVNIEPETYKILILSDKDFSDIELKFNVSTKEYGDKEEVINLDKLEKYKVETTELEFVKNKEVTIEDVKYKSATSPLENVFSIISLLAAIPALIFIDIFLLLLFKFK